MSDTPTQSYERRRLRDQTISLPVAALFSLLPAGGGVVGTGMLGSSFSAELREFRIEVRAQLEALQREVTRIQQDHTAALKDTEGRVRVLELRGAERRAREGVGPR